MKLGIQSAILDGMTFEEVIDFAAENDFECVEIMCWPVAKAERKYAGVTHIDVVDFTQEKANYINEQGLKTIFNKNIGNVDLTLMDLVVKLFKLLGYEVFEIGNNKQWQLMVSKNQQTHTIEVVTDDKKQIMDIFITMSLWKKYQQSHL